MDLTNWIKLVVLAALLTVVGCDSNSGSERFTGIVRTTVGGDVIEEDDGEDWRVDCEEIPLAVRPAYPNPAEARVNLDFSLGMRAHVRVTIESKPGTRVATLVDEVRDPGSWRVVWRPHQTALASGIYRAYIYVESSDGATCESFGDIKYVRQ